MFKGGLTHALRRDERGDRPLCQGNPRTAAWARRGYGASTACRCRISAATIPTRTSSTRKDLYDLMMSARRARFRRGVRRRRRPQPDHRQAASSSRLRTRSRCSRPMRIWRRATSAGIAGIARSMPTSAARRPRGRKARHRHVRDADRLEVLRQPARCRHGRRSAARKAPAPAPTMCARRTGCGRCCSGSTSSRCAARASKAIVREALGGVRAQLLFAPRLRRGRQRPRQRPDGGSARALATLPGQIIRRSDGRDCRRLRLSRSGRRLGQRQSGRAHPVRRRIAHRVPPVRHRHVRRDACASISSATSRMRHATGSRRRTALADLIAAADNIAGYQGQDRPRQNRSVIT